MKRARCPVGGSASSAGRWSRSECKPRRRAPSQRPPAPVVASGIRVRSAAPGDLAAAELLFDSASGEFTIFAGSPARARRALVSLWQLRGHSMSYERAWVAEVDGRVAGVAVGFPASARYRLPLTLLRRAVGYLPASRWFLVPPA